MSDDWFRSPEWSPEAQADFEARLRRARGHNKTQYMRIKGRALYEAGHVAAARGLWIRILDDVLGYDFERASTLEHLGDSYAQVDSARAEHYYRVLLEKHPTLNGTTAIVEISLAEMLIEKGDPASLDEALALLNAWLERGVSQFPNVLFRWHLALIRIAEARGDREMMQCAARTALHLASQGPVFPRHKEVGVVHADHMTLKRLEKLAR